MAYATVSDMVSRFGQAEMIRLSASGPDLPGAPDAARIGVALDDATALIESYLRARYLVPLNPVPREVVRACCILARCDLQQGGEGVPSDEVRRERDATLKWLESMASSEGKLDAPAAPMASDARTRDRARFLTPGQDEVSDILRGFW